MTPAPFPAQQKASLAINHASEALSLCAMAKWKTVPVPISPLPLSVLALLATGNHGHSSSRSSHRSGHASNHQQVIAGLSGTGNQRLNNGGRTIARRCRGFRCVVRIGEHGGISTLVSYRGNQAAFAVIFNGNGNRRTPIRRTSHQIRRPSLPQWCTGRCQARCSQ